jgi:hypothetical protein
MLKTIEIKTGKGRVFKSDASYDVEDLRISFNNNWFVYDA